MNQTEKESLLAEIEALKKKIEAMETPCENVDNRKLTPMGNVFDNFKKRTDYDFLNWMSVYEKELLEQEREAEIKLIKEVIDFPTITESYRNKLIERLNNLTHP